MTHSVETFTHCGPNPEEHPDVIEMRRARDALRQDPLGCIDVGADRVMRSLTLDNEAIDAIGLPPRLLKAMLDTFPYNKDVEAKYRGVHGTKVSKDQWMNPDPSVLRKPLAPEVKEREKKWPEELRELIDENTRKLERGETSSCGHVVQANYDVLLKRRCRDFYPIKAINEWARLMGPYMCIQGQFGTVSGK